MESWNIRRGHVFVIYVYILYNCRATGIMSDPMELMFDGGYYTRAWLKQFCMKGENTKNSAIDSLIPAFISHEKFKLI